MTGLDGKRHNFTLLAIAAAILLGAALIAVLLLAT